MSTKELWRSVTVGKVARQSSLIWIHEVQEHEGMLRQSIAQWPDKTYRLAVHIQEAIDQGTDEACQNWKHKVEAMAALLDWVPHITRPHDTTLGASDCPACAWAKLKEGK